MKVAALVLVHRLPEQAAALISCLLTQPCIDVIVHVDKKAPDCFESLKKQFAANPRVDILQKRYKVFWGSYGQIQATYALLKAANTKACDYAFLLSGQDFPIKPLSDFVSFLENNSPKNFVEYFALPDKQWDGGGLERLQYYRFNNAGFPKIINKVNGLVFRTQKLLGLKRAIELPLYGGSNWFVLHATAIKAICNYVSAHPDFLRRFKFSNCADEIFIQTALLRVINQTHITNDNLRFIDWSSGPEFPRTLRANDFERLIEADNKFFARKFDTTVDQEILSKLHAHVTR